MIKSWLKYLTLLSSMTAFKYFYNDYIPNLFIIILLIIPFISIVYVIIGIFTVKPYIELESKIYVKNEIAKLNLIVYNKLKLIFTTVKIDYSIPSIYDETKKKQSLILNINSEEAKITLYEMKCKYRGLYYSYLYNMEIYDLFKLFKWKLNLNNKVEFKVYPKRLIIPTGSALENENPQAIRFNSFFNNYSEIIGTHKYKMGDELKFIHWKNSSKLDDIIVKEFQTETEAANLIVVDLESRYDSENDFISGDGIIETSIALAYNFLQNDIYTDILWYSDSKNKIICDTLSSEVEFDEFFLDIALERIYKKDLNLNDLIIDQLSKKVYNSLFIISSVIDLNLIDKLSSILEFTQINLVYFEVIESDLSEKLKFLDYHNIKFWYIKANKILNTFLGD